LKVNEIARVGIVALNKDAIDGRIRIGGASVVNYESLGCIACTCTGVIDRDLLTIGGQIIAGPLDIKYV
jgi:hypothetical protein